MTKAIMIQGAGSNVGKSVLVAGLCRAAVKRGLRVAPFKPQNMSNNAAVTEDGGEIGRAQALQARAAGLRPHTDMNPVLLKPESDVGAQVVVQGQRLTTLKARDYGKMKSQLLPAVLESFDRLKAKADLIIVEGAGSPAEVNLRAGDIANMGFATAAGVPVALIGDIDRGGVIAQLVGTHAVLPQSDRDMIKAFAINKFRGDTRLFDAGMTIIADHTGWSSCGIIPWFADAWRLPAEDVMDIASRPGGPIKVAVPKLNRIANFDDLDPLSATPEVTIEIVEAGRALPGDADLILIPGSKSTIADLAHFRAQGWDVDLRAHVQRGGRVLGICGGYQMLGQTIADPDGIEGEPQTVAGLGLLNVDTVMTPHKHLTEVSGHEVRSGAALTGYEIHIGETTGPDSDTGWITLGDRQEGAESMNGHIQGCYLHGLFSGDLFREAYLSRLGTLTNGHDYETGFEDTLDQLAAHLETHMDVDVLLTIAAAV